MLVPFLGKLMRVILGIFYGFEIFDANLLEVRF